VPKESVRERFKARPNRGSISLSGIPTRDTAGMKRKPAEKERLASAEALAAYQDRLHAATKDSLLIVLQALDTGGKDGTIKNAVGAFNPQGVRVQGFKAPTAEEKRHPFLWRIKKALPRPGEIVIFNRSHYEDAVVPRVNQSLSPAQLARRYAEINRFEAELARRGTHVVKLYLHISNDEQRRRLLRRLNDPDKRWKFSHSDLTDRDKIDDHLAAYDAAIANTSTKQAPWYIIPSDKKWFRDWAVSEILLETLAGLDPQYPKPRLKLEALIERLSA
jgi:PPK2 family polyphosphate:nucleotide phosphotransferase